MTTTRRPSSVSRRRTLATVVTEASSPAVCVVVGLILVTWCSATNGADAAWAALAILLCAGIPMGYIARGVKAGKWDDHHIRRREQRFIPLLVGLASVATASILLLVVDAPSQLIALVLSQLLGLLVVLLLTRFWQVSIHCATAGGLCAVLVVLFGPWALISLAALALVAWSRLVLDAHTRAQVVVGAFLGFLIGITAFPLLTTWLGT